jgi:hypothetical protein
MLPIKFKRTLKRFLPGLLSLVVLIGTAGVSFAQAVADDGSVLPFPPTPSGSVAAPSMQESTYNPLPKPKRLPDDAPNILIVLIDDAGPGLPDTYGGEVHTPTLSRIAEDGNFFQPVSHNGHLLTHSCGTVDRTKPPPHRARRHQCLANDWDGYTGMWPRRVRRSHGFWGNTVTPRRLTASGTTPRRRTFPKPDRLSGGLPVAWSALTISTAF